MAFSLERVLKALLFGASGPLTIKDIQRVFTKFHEQNETPDENEETEETVEPDQPFLKAEGMPTNDVPSLVSATQIREAMDRITAEIEERNEVYRVIERHNGYQLVTSPAMGEWIRLLRDEPRPMKLTQSALETLAVIAYRQPVVRAEIEKIRGVSVDSGLSRLLERELIQIVGRADLPGRPIQYGTTEQFMDFVGVRSVEELPASDVLSPREIDAWLHEVSNRHEPDETDMGLPEGDQPDGKAIESNEEGDEPQSASESEVDEVQDAGKSGEAESMADAESNEESASEDEVKEAG